jgi:hypothetical protein
LLQFGEHANPTRFKAGPAGGSKTGITGELTSPATERERRSVVRE